MNIVMAEGTRFYTWDSDQLFRFTTRRSEEFDELSVLEVFVRNVSKCQFQRKVLVFLFSLV